MGDDTNDADNVDDGLSDNDADDDEDVRNGDEI